MRFERKFIKEGQDPFASVQYATRKSQVRGLDGTTSSIMEVEVPEFWSQMATDILAQKYLRRRDVPVTDAAGKTTMGGETSIRQVVDRLVGCWRHWGDKLGYFDSPADGLAFYDELVYMLLKQMAAPNSPQWFNTGLNWKYGITGNAQGHFYVDPEDNQVKSSTDAYTRPQPHACFIQSVKDDLLGENGIYSLMQREGRIFKYGSGTGTNFSAIRGSGEALGGGGVSSGLMSFLKVLDRAAGAIKSGGTTRRAAKMVCLDLDHPEIEEFITWKSREEAKVAAMIAGSSLLKEGESEIIRKGADSEDPKGPGMVFAQAGVWNRARALLAQGELLGQREIFDSHFEGEAYTTVSGQNSNNSVRVPDAFLEAVKSDGDWNLLGRVDGKIIKTIKARKLWESVGRSAWDCADPGVQYDDTINDWHTCPNDGRIRASNPCSEYMFLDDTACNLASLNLVTFQNPDSTLDVPAYAHAIRLWTVVLDISVGMAQFPSTEIARRSFDYRTLGLGYANLGAFLMRAGIPYDSAAASDWTATITAILGGESYAASAEIAASLGAFPRYAANRDSMLRVIRNHERAVRSAAASEYENLAVIPRGLAGEFCPESMVKAARDAWERALIQGAKHGFRNAQVTVLAPTGTIGLIMDCDTTGIEPDFSMVKFKKLAGGGYFKIVNQSLGVALNHLKYPAHEVNAIERFCLGYGTLEGSPHVNRITLAERGFNEEILRKIENALPLALSLEDIFHPRLIGRDVLIGLGIRNTALEGDGYDVLESLGFTYEQIQEADIYICGAQTVEGAPFLKNEHYAVFDCASVCGKGVRMISSLGHLRIMAAAQPFISGAISKTVNLSNEATIEDILDIYREGHQGMLKAISIYRDGCKLSQPLNAKKTRKKTDTTTWETVKPGTLAHPSRPIRRKLPPKRHGFVQEVTVGGHKLFLRTGEYPDGSLGEIFIDMYKEGAAYRGIINCFAVLTSKALQYGVPLEELVDTFTFTRFEPAGPVEGHENIKNCTSLLDLIFRVLGFSYLGETGFVHIKPIESLGEHRSNEVNGLSGPIPEAPQSVMTPGPAKPYSVTVSAGATRSEAADFSRRAGYTGDGCTSCGSMRVRRNGTCVVCEDCGTTSGCS